MTKVRMVQEGAYFNVVADGHAGYGESGTDIVCAAISILVHAFAELCVQYDSENSVTIDKLDMRNGYIEILVCDTYKKLNAAIDMLVKGMVSIADDYPDNICLEWGEN